MPKDTMRHPFYNRPSNHPYLLPSSLTRLLPTDTRQPGTPAVIRGDGLYPGWKKAELYLCTEASSTHCAGVQHSVYAVTDKPVYPGQSVSRRLAPGRYALLVALADSEGLAGKYLQVFDYVTTIRLDIPVCPYHKAAVENPGAPSNI